MNFGWEVLGFLAFASSVSFLDLLFFFSFLFLFLFTFLDDEFEFACDVDRSACGDDAGRSREEEEE